MIDYKNLPDKTTPLHKSNLNLMQQISIASVTIASGTTITNGYEVTLPIKYQVGNNSLEVRLNSEVLKLATSTEDGHYKEVGNSGALSNKIQFYRTSSDGSWTLTEAINITAVVKGVEQS